MKRTELPLGGETWSTFAPPALVLSCENQVDQGGAGVGTARKCPLVTRLPGVDVAMVVGGRRASRT